MTGNVRFVDERITLKYGTGGGAMRALIEQVFAKGLGEVEDGIGLAAMDDGARGAAHRVSRGRHRPLGHFWNCE